MNPDKLTETGGVERDEPNEKEAERKITADDLRGAGGLRVTSRVCVGAKHEKKHP